MRFLAAIMSRIVGGSMCVCWCGGLSVYAAVGSSCLRVRAHPRGCAVVVIMILPFLVCFRFWGLFLGVLVVVDGGGWWGLVCGFVCFSSWGGACDGCGVVFLWLVDGAWALLGPAV